MRFMVDKDSFVKHDKEYFAASIPWEMTWFGFDEEAIQEHVKHGSNS